MTKVDIILWILAGTLAVVWLLFVLGNIMSIIGTFCSKRPTSLGLFVGGIAGALGLLLCPLPGTGRWVWLPPLLDIGCLPAAILMCHAAFTRPKC